MVLIKKLFLLFATFTSVIALPNPAQILPSEKDISMDGLEVHDVRDVSALEQRALGPMTLQWSPQGQFLFMAGLQIPQGIYDAFFSSSIGINDFAAAEFYMRHALEGGIMNITPFSNNGYDVGFGIFAKDGVSLTQEVVNAMITVIRRWAEANSGSLTVIQAANGFIDPAQIGATPTTKRGRVATCPSGINLLKPGTTPLLNHAHLKSVDSEGNTLLHLVAEYNIDNVISRLSPTTAAKSMVENNAGQTPLHIAVKKGHYGIVQELLSTGCNPSPTDKYSRTPLHYACLTKQDITMVRLLLAHGADASAKDKEDRTPIHICCTHGQAALLKALIDSGADINAAENGEVDSGARGQTPFHNAVLRGQTECAKILLKRGADPNLLYGPGEHVIGSAVFSGQTELVQLMLDKGADVNRADRLGLTPLMYAATVDREQIARILLHAGANPNIRGPRDGVALHGAARSGLPSIAKLLLDAGADPSITDRSGFSPLDYAMKKEATPAEWVSTPGHESVVKLLQQAQQQSEAGLG
ncbi:ankyrin repeat domain-containing protein [Aspergillus thermomutatus]|uniref:Uncharacterized protein n=1 Tax=Aspergillus thermomutatus TaxID=41047 RepID=A0A397FZY3_ASPTH|nr:uncharacterized protein CDV56_101678 [Aspergillus thermomutatus]RHZ43359.1 hypothetical protein CDV56_101678 [Aspergillus thermomutatus]